MRIQHVCIGTFLIIVILLSIVFFKCTPKEFSGAHVDNVYPLRFDAIPDERVARKVADAIMQPFFEIIGQESRDSGNSFHIEFSDFAAIVLLNEQRNEWVVYYWPLFKDVAFGGREMLIRIRRDNGMISSLDYDVVVDAFPEYFTEEAFAKMDEEINRFLQSNSTQN